MIDANPWMTKFAPLWPNFIVHSELKAFLSFIHNLEVMDANTVQYSVNWKVWKLLYEFLKTWKRNIFFWTDVLFNPENFQ